MKGQPMIEIGPHSRPYILKSEHDVYYADIRSYDELLALPGWALQERREKLSDYLAPVDYVIHDTYEKAVEGKRFAVVFSSHVLEHVPDPIAHMRDISNILTDEGFFAMAIPDKRYMFDRFREVTPFRDLYDMYSSGGDMRVIAKLALDNGMNHHPSNDPLRHWDNLESFRTVLDDGERFIRALNLFNQMRDHKINPSCHFWVLTYPSFLNLLRDCLRANLLPFTLHQSFPPVRNSLEFSVILKKDTAILNDQERRAKEIIRINDLAEQAEMDSINENKIIKHDDSLCFCALPKSSSPFPGRSDW
jgi:predicted SAM-dependent methyltransferase